MAREKLKKLVAEHVKQSKEYWADKPPITQEERDAIKEMADKKNAIFKKLLDTPEKRERINKLLKST